MNTVGKVLDATVIVGSAYIGYEAVKSLIQDSKMKNYGGLLLGGVTLLISVYAFKRAIDKIND